MGSRITVEEINSKSEQEILDIKQEISMDMKPEVKAIFNRRKAEIQAKIAAGGAPLVFTASPTPLHHAIPPEEETKAENPARSAVSAASSSGAADADVGEPGGEASQKENSVNNSLTAA